MKKNNVNLDHLVEMIKYNGAECDEVVSHYTKQSIGNCQDKNFLMLLLKNFTRGPYQDVIENALEKINEQIEQKVELVNDLTKKNRDLVKQIQEE